MRQMNNFQISVIKKISLTVLFCFFIAFSFCQFNIDNQFTQSDAAKFDNIKFFPVSEYTGKANIKIPIFSLELDGLKIPISINYNTGGIKVNQMATEVGLGWELVAGGKINKNLNGYNDNYFTWFAAANFPVDSQVNNIYGMYNSSRLFRPDHYDEFFVSVPGLSTRFVIDAGWHPKELQDYMKDSISFTRAFNDSNVTSLYGLPPIGLPVGSKANYPMKFFCSPCFLSGLNKWWYEVPDFQQFDITRMDGFHYVFGEWEHELPASTASIVGQSAYHGGLAAQGYHSSYLLTQILSPLSSKKIIFSYDTVALFDSVVIAGKNFNQRKQSTNPDGVRYYLEDFNTLAGNGAIRKNIKQIVSDEATVNFNYTAIRNDYKGIDMLVADNNFNYANSNGKLLSSIDILNNSGNLINKYVFNYGYFNSSGCTSVNCKRLKLLSVSKYGSDPNTAPEIYTFTYNEQNALPPVGCPTTDAWGYNNDPNLTNTYQAFGATVPKPKLYQYTLNGNIIYSPFYTSANPPISSIGDYDKSSNFQASQAWSLNTVTYPLGGSVKLTYEANDFIWNNSKVSGGGIRVKQIETDTSNSKVEQIQYLYTDSSGKSSGSVVDVPLFTGKQSCSSTTAAVEIFSQPKIKYTQGSEVGYSQVTIVKNGIETTVKKFISPAQVADSAQYGVVIDGNLNPVNIFSFSNDHLRGLETDETIYNGTAPLRCTHYNFQYYVYDSLQTSAPFNNGVHVPANTQYQVDYELDYYPYTASASCPVSTDLSPTLYYYSDKSFTLFNKNVKLGSQNLQSVTTTTYDASGHQNIVTETLGYKSPFANLVTTQDITNSKGEIFETAYTYPFSSYSNSSGIAYLFSNHILNPKISVTTTNLKTSTLLHSVFNDYNLFGTLSLPSTMRISYYNGTPRINVKINQYNAKGKVLEYVDQSGLTNTLLYGYNGNYMVATIVGQGYNTVSQTINQSVLDNPASDDALRTELNKLRTLPNSLVSAATYKPLIGMTSMIDTRGKATYYNYDGLNRLSFIQDNDKNIIKRFQYKYYNDLASGIPAISAPFSNDNTLSQVFSKNSGCPVGTTIPSLTYTISPSQFTSFISIADADQQAVAAFSSNGQVAANALACTLIQEPINGTNPSTTAINVNFSNTATNSNFNLYPNYTNAPLGTVPYGTYNIALTASSGSTLSGQLTINGVSQTGLTASNVAITSSNIIGFLPVTATPASGPCSITPSAGFGFPTSNLNSSGTSVSVSYIVFYYSGVMSQGNSYLIGTISANGRPSAARSLSASSGGRTWTITINPNGNIYVQMAYGNAATTANQTISLSPNTSYNL